MKRLIYLISVIAISYSISAQNSEDALRFSESFSGGTARSTAMGGAFGALGADFYSTSQNPAGLGLYRRSELEFTPELYSSKTKSSYLSHNTTDYKYNFNVNSFSYVGSYRSKREKGLIGVTMAFGFNRLNNFNNYTTIQGTNSQSSLADHYAQTANNYADLDNFSDGLFYDAYLIDYDSSTNQYYKNKDMTLPGIQHKTIDRSGKESEWNFGSGFNISNIFFIGTSFNILPVDYSESSNFYESDANYPTYQYFNFNEETNIHGTGFGGKIGAIIVPIPLIHVGFAFHTPVKYNLNYSYLPSISSQYVNGIVYPYNNEGGLTYDYSLITPYKMVGSLGFIIGKIAIISADMEYINYASMRMKSNSDQDYIDQMNQEIKNRFTSSAFNVKTGAEVRFGPVYLRGGFDYFGSPYKSNPDNSTLGVAYNEGSSNSYHLVYNAGIGFRQQSFYIDFAWSYMTQQQSYVLYDYVNPANNLVNYTADLQKHDTKIMTTFGIRF